jgi:hypothetical protein
LEAKMSKGSKKRPYNQKKFDDGFINIFGHKIMNKWTICPDCGRDKNVKTDGVKIYCKKCGEITIKKS